MIEVVLKDDTKNKKLRVRLLLNADDTLGDLKRIVAAKTKTQAKNIRKQKWYNIYKDHVILKAYEIRHGMELKLYFN